MRGRRNFVACEGKHVDLQQCKAQESSDDQNMAGYPSFAIEAAGLGLPALSVTVFRGSLPVMVFIHGGGFQMGAGSQPVSYMTMIL
jgi:acetyl esterase/lipase